MPFRCYRTVGGMDTKLVSFAILGFVLIASVGSVSGFSDLVCFALVLPGLAREVLSEAGTRPETARRPELERSGLLLCNSSVEAQPRAWRDGFFGAWNDKRIGTIWLS